MSPYLETLPEADDRTDCDRPRRTVVERRRAPGSLGRILAVARSPVGGLRTHLLYNYSTVVAAGFGVTVVVPEDGSLAALREGFADIEGTQVVGVPVRWRRCRLWPTVRRLLRSGRFHLLHSHGIATAVSSSLARFGLRIPHVVTLHEPFRAGQFGGLFGWLKRWTLGTMLRRVDALITVSDDARVNLQGTFPGLCRGASQILTLSNGIHVGGCSYALPRRPHDLRRRLGIGPSTVLIGFLDSFLPEKGFPVLLEAVRGLAEQVPPTRFHLAAFSSGDSRRACRRLLDEYRLSHLVSLLDFVPDVRPVVRQLDLVVVPSLWDASSLISMEAMAAGVPVLGSDCSGLREVLRGTPSRTITPGDVDALQQGLRLALENPWTEAARDYAATARTRFDNAGSARRLTDLFVSLARPGR
jgi:glycosyltransferase involved in cell wall biosynthesis